MCTGEGQWKPSSDLSSEGRANRSSSHSPGPQPVLTCRGFHLSLAPSHWILRATPPGEGRGWAGRALAAAPGSLCVFVSGVRLTYFAHELGLMPCSADVFAICQSLAPTLAKFGSTISSSGGLRLGERSASGRTTGFFTTGAGRPSHGNGGHAL